MKKMTIAEAADFFGVSKEAIHNRVRRGSLESEIVDGEKHVFVDGDKSTTKTNTTKKTTRATTSTSAPRERKTNVDDRYYSFLKEENSKLQAKVEKLENETRTLRDQKEQMLIDEREKIEQIYKEKDEQLKNIIHAISSKFMLQMPSQQKQNDNEIDADIVIDDIIEQDYAYEDSSPSHNPKTDESSILTSLNKYLKARDFSKKKRKKIKAKFEKNANKDKRVIKLNNKIYIDLGKYNYSDYSL